MGKLSTRVCTTKKSKGRMRVMTKVMTVLWLPRLRGACGGAQPRRIKLCGVTDPRHIHICGRSIILDALVRSSWPFNDIIVNKVSIYLHKSRYVRHHPSWSSACCRAAFFSCHSCLIHHMLHTTPHALATSVTIYAFE